MSGRLTQARLRLVVGLSLLGLALSAATLVVLGSLGPTGPGEPRWHVRVLNDLSQPVTLTSSAEALNLLPGESDIFVATGPGKPTLRLVASGPGSRIMGCLTVRLDPSRQLDVRASQLKPC
jgi:hypothetical protein